MILLKTINVEHREIPAKTCAITLIVNQYNKLLTAVYERGEIFVGRHYERCYRLPLS